MERKEPRSEDAHEEELAMAANDGVREVQPKNNLAIMKRDATPNELGTATDQGDDPQEIQEGAAFSAAAGAGIGSQQNSLSGLSI
jgi:hypothetical protein